MILWRISNHETLDGRGGLLVSGRWHTKGHQVVYCAQNPATCLLEILVHLEVDAGDLPETFQVLKIEAPDAVSRHSFEPGLLPPSWPDNQGLTQGMGNVWLEAVASCLLEVPSVLLPETWNVLINPLHPDFKLLKIVAVYDHPYDPRLF